MILSVSSLASTLKRHRVWSGPVWFGLLLLLRTRAELSRLGCSLCVLSIVLQLNFWSLGNLAPSHSLSLARCGSWLCELQPWIAHWLCYKIVVYHPITSGICFQFSFAIHAIFISPSPSASLRSLCAPLLLLLTCKLDSFLMAFQLRHKLVYLLPAFRVTFLSWESWNMEFIGPRTARWVCKLRIDEATWEGITISFEDLYSKVYFEINLMLHEGEFLVALREPPHCLGWHEAASTHLSHIWAY